MALVIVFLGWFLNKIGLLSAFKTQVSEFQTFFNQAKKIMDVGGAETTEKAIEKGSGSYITLPDGKQVKVQITQ